MSDKGVPPYRLDVCIEIAAGHGRWQTLPTEFHLKRQAISAGEALWLREAIPNLCGIRVISSDGTPVGEDLYRS
jgi:hypothetical protein